MGIVLAGGQGRRVGGADKALLTLGHETLMARGIARCVPQVGELLISANGEPERYASFGLEIVADRIGGFLGPLAGILAGLDWMRANRPTSRWLASFACDSPFFPPDLVERLTQAAEAEGALIAVAASANRHHPVFAIWNADIPDTSESALGADGLRKVDDFITLFPHTFVKFPCDPVDPFFNINTPDDLARAEALMAMQPAIR